MLRQSTKISSSKTNVVFSFNKRVILYRQDGYRQRRSFDFMNRHFADLLYRRFYERDNNRVYGENMNKQSEIPIELRPVAGPISIEQLPAMLAARYVKRYPYSQRDDPAIM